MSAAYAPSTKLPPNIMWSSIFRLHPPFETKILMFTEDNLGHRGGVYLGTLHKDDKFFIQTNGPIEEPLSERLWCTYWALVDDPAEFNPAAQRQPS